MIRPSRWCLRRSTCFRSGRIWRLSNMLWTTASEVIINWHVAHLFNTGISILANLSCIMRGPRKCVQKRKNHQRLILCFQFINLTYLSSFMDIARYYYKLSTSDLILNIITLLWYNEYSSCFCFCWFHHRASVSSIHFQLMIMVRLTISIMCCTPLSKNVSNGDNRVMKENKNVHDQL